MNKNELLEKLEKLFEEDEFEEIIDTVVALPDKALNDDILCLLAAAYNANEEYKKAIAVLEGIRPRMEMSYKWQYRMGYALFYASMDEECEDDEELASVILERSRVAFARCMNLNPPEDWLEDCDRFMELIEEELRRIEGDPEEDYDEDELDTELYTEEELDAVEDHIRDYFGDFPTVLHEIFSPDIHVDVCLIPPSEERNFYTLVTLGMGAHVMNIPEELPKDKLGRAELVMCLPPDWKVGENDDRWFWPIALMKNLARLPIACDTWLGYGHSIDNQESFCDETKLCGSLLISPEEVPVEALSCELPNGEPVNFYEIAPLYREEMEYKIENDTEALLKVMSDVSHVVDISRPNTCNSFLSNVANNIVYDRAFWHARKIDDKNLSADHEMGCAHLAIYLRWCIENDLVSGRFTEAFPDTVQQVKDGALTDLRPFMKQNLKARLTRLMFSNEGNDFADFFYDDYTGEIDKYAEQYFGTERYNSDEFQDEAYLFVDFDEKYYRHMKAVLDENYAKFRFTEENRNS